LSSNLIGQKISKKNLPINRNHCKETGKIFKFWHQLNLSAIAKTMPASLSGSVSPENLGSVISNKASAICKMINDKEKQNYVSTNQT